MTATTQSHPSTRSTEPIVQDAIVIGAGLTGIRTLIELNSMGKTVTLLEGADDVGGTWYWNRYPGARTDSQSWSYQFPIDGIEREWRWKERYPSQAEVQKYVRFLVDRFKLDEQVKLNSRVTSAHFDDSTSLWEVRTADGRIFITKMFVTCLGLLAQPKRPDIAGLDDFEGPVLMTSKWPKEKVDFTGKKVAVIGTGASAVQVIPIAAKSAERLTVFQRTPNFVMPAQNHYLDDEQWSEIQKNLPESFEIARNNYFGLPIETTDKSFNDITDDKERRARYEKAWLDGGFHMAFETFNDIVVNKDSNDAVVDFIHGKIRATVHDPEVADLLCPKTYPYIAKRPPAGTNYYETFNRANVELVDISAEGISHVTETSVVANGEAYDVDMIVLATGFDAVTGSFADIDIRGAEGRSLKDAWKEGPLTNLGIAVPGFPNMLMISGPQSSYANIPVVVEMIMPWLSSLLDHMDANGHSRVETTQDAADQWTEMCKTVFEQTLISQGDSGSWYFGANIPGKPRRVLLHLAGADAYNGSLQESTASKFSEFTLT